MRQSHDLACSQRHWRLGPLRGDRQRRLRPSQRLRRRHHVAGGNVSLNGNWNFVTESGAIAIDETGAGDRHNTFDVTTGVTTLAVNNTKPTDTFQMHGFTPADISAGLASAQRFTPTAEFVTFSHAASGGSPAHSVGVLLTDHDASAFPTAAQFRAA